jgi:hypothetical protein
MLDSFLDDAGAKSAPGRPAGKTLISIGAHS